MNVCMYVCMYVPVDTISSGSDIEIVHALLFHRMESSAYSSDEFFYSMYVCMCAHIYVYMYVCMFLYVCMYICIYIYICFYMCRYEEMYVFTEQPYSIPFTELHTVIHTFIHTYIHTYIHRQINTYIHTYIQCRRVPLTSTLQ